MLRAPHTQRVAHSTNTLCYLHTERVSKGPLYASAEVTAAFFSFFFFVGTFGPVRAVRTLQSPSFDKDATDDGALKN